MESSKQACHAVIYLGSWFNRLTYCLEALILLSSKSFDPKAFLTAVHPNATYQDLASAVSHLRTSIDSRSEAIRVLVEDNFDRFVAVKSNADGKSSTTDMANW
jgi:hypothetical protein